MIIIEGRRNKSRGHLCGTPTICDRQRPVLEFQLSSHATKNFLPYLNYAYFLEVRV